MSKFEELLKDAPVRTTVATWQGLFGLELIVTSRAELDQALAACQKEVVDRLTGKTQKRTDEEAWRAWVATRVVGFQKLTLQMAMTLCGRTLTEEMKARAKEPLPCEVETVVTLLNLVTGLQLWLTNELGLIAIDAARLERESTEN